MTKKNKSKPSILSLSIAAATRKNHLRTGMVMASTMVTAFGSVYTFPVLAQEAVVDEVVVTGSRIRRQDFTANSPIFTVGQEEFTDTGTIGVETILNQLPQFVPAVTQFNTTDVQNTAQNTVGASTVSLRGLGANRSLVLVNGRRPMPVNPTMVVDTNSIPAAAVQRVEVISGGASAVYGADAVGGVVNFMLKDNFEGAQIESRYSDTQEGGGASTTLSALVGANVGDGRGNVMLGVTVDDRKVLRQNQRKWRVDDFKNPSIGGSAFFPTETWFTAPQGVSNPPSQAAMNQVFSALPPGTIPRTQNVYHNRTADGTGTVYSGFNAATAPGVYKYTGKFENPEECKDIPFRKQMPDGRLTENNCFNNASNPLDRFSAFGQGVFNLTDTMRIRTMAMFTKTNTFTALGLTSDAVGAHGAVVPHGSGIYAPSLASDGSTRAAFLPGGSYGLNCPSMGGCTNSQAWPVPPEVAFLLASRANPNGSIQVNRPLDFLRTGLGGGRQSRNSTQSFQLSFGLEGELPVGEHFWDVSYSVGETENLIRTGGAGKLETWRAINQSPNFGVNWQAVGNPSGGGFQSGVASCTTGLPIVRDFTPSQDCITALGVTLQNSTTMQQDVIEANLTGTIMEIPAGALQYALGAGYRENAFAFYTDPLQSNEAINETIMGLFPQQNSSGQLSVKEIYGELLVPLISDGPFGVEHLTLELGGRISDFDIPRVSKVNSYKVLLDWGITQDYRVRGGFNRANRAPNLAELFMVRTQTFAGTGAVFGDQCSLRNQGPFSASQGVDPSAPMTNVNGLAGAQRTQAICRQLMSAIGAEQYYDSRALADHPLGGGVGLPNASGNQNLLEETADTVTIGIVASPFEGFTATLDWYKIEIKDMIASESGDVVFERCLNPAMNTISDPILASQAPACQALLRNPDSGGASSVDLFFTNQGWTQFSGIDLALNWRGSFDFGGLSLNMAANYNLGEKTRATPTSTVIDWQGTMGCALGMQCQGYDYRVFTTASWFSGPYSVSLRNQFWPSIDAGASATNPNTTAVGVTSSYTLWDLNGGYRMGDRYTFRAGIQNVFGKLPPRAGGNVNATPFPTIGNRAPAGTYDPLGRRYFISVTADF
jgi:iron complex outermembrane recepter protein